MLARCGYPSSQRRIERRSSHDIPQHIVPKRGGPPAERSLAAPVFFVDLNLDQIVAAITAGKAEYNLAPFFHWPLRDVDAVHYRHEVMRDLEDIALFGNMKTFAAALRSMRETLKELEKRHYRHQKEALFLDAVDAYCGAIALPDARLGPCEPALARPPVVPQIYNRLRGVGSIHVASGGNQKAQSGLIEREVHSSDTGRQYNGSQIRLRNRLYRRCRGDLPQISARRRKRL